VVSVAKSITEEHIGIDLIKSECWEVDEDERRVHDLFQDFPLVAVDVMLLPPEVDDEIPGCRWESIDEWEWESNLADYPGLELWMQTLHTLAMSVTGAPIVEDMGEIEDRWVAAP
jgi:hypothetical protein